MRSVRCHDDVDRVDLKSRLGYYCCHYWRDVAAVAANDYDD